MTLQQCLAWSWIFFKNGLEKHGNGMEFYTGSSVRTLRFRVRVKGGGHVAQIYGEWGWHPCTGEGRWSHRTDLRWMGLTSVYGSNAVVTSHRSTVSEVDIRVRVKGGGHVAQIYGELGWHPCTGEGRWSRRTDIRWVGLTSVYGWREVVTSHRYTVSGVDIRVRVKGGGHVAQIYGELGWHPCTSEGRWSRRTDLRWVGLTSLYGWRGVVTSHRSTVSWVDIRVRVKGGGHVAQICGEWGWHPCTSEGRWSRRTDLRWVGLTSVYGSRAVVTSHRSTVSWVDSDRNKEIISLVRRTSVRSKSLVRDSLHLSNK